MDLNIELKDLSLNLELKPLEIVELNLSLDETKSLTGRSEPEEEKRIKKYVRDNSNSTFSFSRMNFNCEYEYYLTYQKNNRGKDNIYSIMGSLCHDINEKYYHSQISKEDALKEFIEKFDNIGIYGVEFPSEKAGKNYRECLTQYYTNIERPKNLFVTREENNQDLVEANLKTEEFLWKIFEFGKSNIKIGTYGYADLIHYETRLIDGKEELFYIIGDFKTSSKNDYLGKKQNEKGRQLVIYAEMLNNIISGGDLFKQTPNIELYWNMLKYCNLTINYKVDKLKYLNELKLSDLKSLMPKYNSEFTGKLKKDFVAELMNYDIETENKTIYNEGIERNTIAERLKKIFGNNIGNYENSLDLNDLPEHIKNSIKVEDYRITYDYDNTTRLDLYKWMLEQYYKINEMIDMDKFEPTKLGEWYCLNLCGHKHNCQSYKDYKKKLDEETANAIKMEL